MRTLLIVFLTLLYITANAQDTSKVKLPLIDSYLQYQNVVTLDSTYSESTLYKATKTWFVNMFKSAKYVIQSEDQVNGRFLGKAEVLVPAGLLIYGSVAPEIKFYLQLDVKRGKYRYKIYNFSYAFYDMSNNLVEKPVEYGYNLYLTNKTPRGLLISRKELNKQIGEAYSSMEYQIANLINSLNEAMRNSKNDDF